MENSKISDDEMVPISLELIESGRSRRGAWNKAQLTLLGVAWPPRRKWKRKLIGTFISAIAAKRFVQLKDCHLYPDQ